MTPGLVTLIQNVALLLTIIVVYDLVTNRKTVDGYLQQKIVAGVSLGGICIRLVPFSIRLETRIIFDTRSDLLPLSGLFLSLIAYCFRLTRVLANHVLIGVAGAWARTWVILTIDCIDVCTSHHIKRY